MTGDKMPGRYRWEFNGDGQFRHDRIKGFDKRHIRRKRRCREKRALR